MSLNTSASRMLPRVFLLCAPLLVLASLLAGCDSKPATPAHTFAGTLSVLHVPAPYTLPGSITLGPDGNLWFPAIAYGNFGASNPSGAIGRLTPAGAFTMFPLPKSNSYPVQIAVGPDGNLWFTAEQGNGQVEQGVDTPPAFSAQQGEIGKMTPAGAFSLFPLPAAQTDPSGITAGPDGDLWFTEVATIDVKSYTSLGKIARITTAGALTEFPLPTPNDEPRYITAGSDGNLWFSIQSSQGDIGVGKIGRITPQGTITVFTPGNLYTAGAITSGPDGAVWFAADSHIGRITSAGKISEFSTPGQGFNQLRPAGITAGSDGALWFATASALVGRISTDGTIKEYPFSTSTYFDNGGSSLTLGELKGITSGADGTLWLTDNDQ